MTCSGLNCTIVLLLDNDSGRLIVENWCRCDEHSQFASTVSISQSNAVSTVS